MSIRISPKHGVNPSMLLCPVCGKDNGLALLGLIKNDQEAPRQMPSENICEECEKKFDHYKTIGFVAIVIDDKYEEIRSRSDYESKSPWPYFKRVFVLNKNSELAKHFESHTGNSEIVFVSNSAANELGLTEELAKSQEEQGE